MSKIIPARGCVLIEPLKAEETSAGGVYLPDRVKDMPQKGKVLAIPGWDNISVSQFNLNRFHDWLKDNPPCKVGDIVIFKRFVDNRIKEEGKELLLVRFEDILAMIEK